MFSAFLFYQISTSEYVRTFNDIIYLELSKFVYVIKLWVEQARISLTDKSGIYSFSFTGMCTVAHVRIHLQMLAHTALAHTHILVHTNIQGWEHFDKKILKINPSAWFQFSRYVKGLKCLLNSFYYSNQIYVVLLF